MKKKRSLLLVFAIMLALCMSATFVSTFAETPMTASITKQPDGVTGVVAGSEFKVEFANTGSTGKIMTGVHAQATQDNFPDFINNIYIDKAGGGFKLFKNCGGSINIWGGGNLNVHGVLLGAGDAIKFDTGFKFIQSTDPNDYTKGDAPASLLKYTDAPALTAPIILEREADGKFLLVGDNPIGISLASKDVALETGATFDLKAVTRPKRATNNGITYSSNAEAVATVSASGVITALTAGTATITVTAANNVTETVVVNVTAGIVEAESVSLTETAKTFDIADVYSIVATVLPADTTNKALTYTSDKPDIAEVNANGKILAKTAGTANITVKTTNDKTATFAVTVREGQSNVNVTSHQTSISVPKDNAKAFSFNFTASKQNMDITNIRTNVTAMNPYIILGGPTFADKDGKDQTLDKCTSTDVHFMSGDFYFYNMIPQEGDTIELKAGLKFPIKSKDADYSSKLLFRETLSENYKIIYTSGAWAKMGEVGDENVITAVSKVTTKTGGAVDVDRLSFGMTFKIPVVQGVKEGLEKVAAYNANILIGGKTVAQLNSEYTVTHEEEDDLPAVSISANGATITISVAASVNKGTTAATIIEEGKTFKFELKKEFVSETGMIHTADYVRYYVSEFDFWSTVEPYALEKKSDVYATDVNYEIIDVGVNGKIDIIFNSDIATGALLGYGIHPMYLITSSVPEGFGAKGVVNELASSGAAHDVFNKILINGKSVTQYWKDGDITSYEAMSNLFQIHITAKNTLSIRTHVNGDLGPDKDVVITIKKGFTFLNGAVVNADMIVKYSGTSEKLMSLEYGIELDATLDKGTIEVGGKAQVSSGLGDDNILPITYKSSDETIATVSATGEVTGVKAGKATITATCGNVTDTIEITVKKAVTSVTVEDATVSLEVGATSEIKATVLPADATDKTVTYTSSDTSVATVDANGKITAVKEGTATITVSADGKEATVTVTVTKKASTDKDSGCGSNAIAASATGAMLALILGLGAIILLKRKNTN